MAWDRVTSFFFLTYVDAIKHPSFLLNFSYSQTKKKSRWALTYFFSECGLKVVCPKPWFCLFVCLFILFMVANFNSPRLSSCGKFEDAQPWSRGTQEYISTTSAEGSASRATTGGTVLNENANKDSQCEIHLKDWWFWVRRTELRQLYLINSFIYNF